MSAMCQADSNKNLQRRMNGLLSLEGNLTEEGKQKAKKHLFFSQVLSSNTSRHDAIILWTHRPTHQAA